MSKIRINKSEIEEIKNYNSETMMSIRTSRKFKELTKRWRDKNRKPVKQLIVFAVLKYLLEEGNDGYNL